MAIKIVKDSEVPEWEAPDLGHRRARIYIERDIAPSKEIAAGNVILPIGASQSGNSHAGEEIYYTLRGKGHWILDESGSLTKDAKKYEIEKGDLLFISPGVFHQVHNTGDEEMELYWVLTPAEEVWGEPGEFIKKVEGWKRVR